jgi:hypothetical protein
MQPERIASVIIAIALGIGLSACQPACPPDSIRYISPPPAGVAVEASVTAPPPSQPQEIEIRSLFGTKSITVDEVIEGYLCDDTWRGTLYVTCNIEIPAWEEEAYFFQECDPIIEPGALIYVAAHNDKAYSQGCTCHE